MRSTPDVVEYVDYLKTDKPSMTATEVRSRLLEDGICIAENLPSTRSVYDIFSRDLKYTYKKLAKIPSERFTEANLALFNRYIDTISNIDQATLHFFDECGVKRTTGNRDYGHSVKGQPAFEVQRYASDVNYTVNLLHGVTGVDYFNILNGPSNSLEMLHFFGEVLELVDDRGNPLLMPGDTVVMDNCGFHHERNAEIMLRQMLGDRQINLVFQPPYSPEFNTCELCFRQLKAYLRRNDIFSLRFTELAIREAIGEKGI